MQNERTLQSMVMSATGLGCVKTLCLMGGVRLRRDSFYALIAAISGWTPLMFITRVRL